MCFDINVMSLDIDLMSIYMQTPKSLRPLRLD